MSREYHEVRLDADHPCVALFGFFHKRGRPTVYEHKLVLFEKVGSGPQLCHWCGRPLVWGRGSKTGTVVADHVDGNPRNNEPSNLVTACTSCNTLRSRTFRPAISPDELFVTRPDGSRRRAGEVTCRICGVMFLAPLYRIRNGEVRTCSKSCAGHWNLRSG